MARHTRYPVRPLVGALALSAAMLAPGTGIAHAQDAPRPAATSEAKQERLRNTKEWDLNRKSLAIEGYDPVAYFPEGGGKPKKGKKSLEYTYKGVNYRFATATNRALFKKAPDRYEPAHGGWCSWAMAKGTKTEIDPKSFIVKDDRLFLFYKGLFGDTRKDWLKGSHVSLTKQADAEWKDISEEEPHSAPAPEKG